MSHIMSHIYHVACRVAYHDFFYIFMCSWAVIQIFFGAFSSMRRHPLPFGVWKSGMFEEVLGLPRIHRCLLADEFLRALSPFQREPLCLWVPFFTGRPLRVIGRPPFLCFYVSMFIAITHLHQRRLRYDDEYHTISTARTLFQPQSPSKTSWKKSLTSRFPRKWAIEPASTWRKPPLTSWYTMRGEKVIG